MGQILSIHGVCETVLDPEEDLERLIEKYIGIDARDLFRDIRERDRNAVLLAREDVQDRECEVTELENRIDDARYLLDRLEEQIDDLNNKEDIKKKLKNIYWALG